MNFNHKLFFKMIYSFEKVIPSSFDQLKTNLVEANNIWNSSRNVTLVMDNMLIYLFILNDKVENLNNSSYKFTDAFYKNKIIFVNISK